MKWLPAPQGDLDLMQALGAHLEQHYGSVVQVWHEEESHIVHLDAHQIEPFEGVPQVIFTTGMSSKAMNVGEDYEDSPYVELLLYLEPDWDLSEEGGDWPIHVLLDIARYPHLCETCVDSYHTIDSGSPFRGSEYTSVLLLDAIFLPEEDRQFRHPDGREIRLLMVGMLYPEEVAYARDHGTSELFDRLTEGGVLPFDLFVLQRERARPLR